jgi:peptide/nickel transport system ATP-binding protein
VTRALAFEGVTIVYANGYCAVRDASFDIASGECLALVGESGCGKTTMARAALGLLPVGARIEGSIRVGETEIVGASPTALRRLRGLVAGFVSQDPFSACHPLLPVAYHIEEAWRAHALPPPRGAAISLLSKFGVRDAERMARRYPHEWSGGMLQRAVIAAASAHRPPLIIADEPTSALDAELADGTLQALRATGASILLITHDLQLAARHAGRLVVCHNGRIVETGAALEILNTPQHPYTKSLLAAAAPRSASALRADAEVIAEAVGVSRIWGQGENAVTAVAGVNLRVQRGECIGICGPSGSGKSTLLRLLATIERPSAGKVYLNGSARPARNGFVMPVFQDATGSLDRRWPVWRTIAEPLTAAHRKETLPAAVRREIARAQLVRVGLDGIDPEARPERLSAGQCQRVAIARALTAAPSLIVADEPTSALDASTSAGILRLLAGTTQQGTALVIVSHDRQMLRGLCHRLLTMKDGRLVEESVNAEFTE